MCSFSFGVCLGCNDAVTARLALLLQRARHSVPHVLCGAFPHIQIFKIRTSMEPFVLA